MSVFEHKTFDWYICFDSESDVLIKGNILTDIVMFTHNIYGAVCVQLAHFSLGDWKNTVHPKKDAHGFVVLCFVVVMQSFIMNSREVFIHIHQGCFAGTGAIVRLPQCQWSKPDGHGKISQCITTTQHSKAKTVCIFLGIYCICIAHVIIIIKSEVSNLPLLSYFSVVVCLRCFLHHILSLIAYTFRENWDFVVIITA